MFFFDQHVENGVLYGRESFFNQPYLYTLRKKSVLSTLYHILNANIIMFFGGDKEFDLAIYSKNLCAKFHPIAPLMRAQTRHQSARTHTYIQKPLFFRYPDDLIDVFAYQNPIPMP